MLRISHSKGFQIGPKPLVFKLQTVSACTPSAVWGHLTHNRVSGYPQGPNAAYHCPVAPPVPLNQTQSLSPALTYYFHTEVKKKKSHFNPPSRGERCFCIKNKFMAFIQNKALHSLDLSKHEERMD